MILDEKSLLEKLRRIEALHAGATTPGERDAAANAMRSIQARLKLVEKEQPPVEYKFTLADHWSRKLFMALARRYGLKPYRYRRQRHTTVMVRVPKRFVDDTLWPEFVELDRALRDTLERATDQVLGQVFEQETSEAEVRDEQRLVGPIGGGSDGEA
jgi:tRNA nucleotidyltransferase (CCA-adding enzyme)